MTEVGEGAQCLSFWFPRSRALLLSFSCILPHLTPSPLLLYPGHTQPTHTICIPNRQTNTLPRAVGKDPANPARCYALYSPTWAVALLQSLNRVLLWQLGPSLRRGRAVGRGICLVRDPADMVVWWLGIRRGRRRCATREVTGSYSVVCLVLSRLGL